MGSKATLRAVENNNTTEVVEMPGAEAKAAWEEYSASDLPQHIGSFHLCLTLHALVKTGIAAKLKEDREFTSSELIGSLDQHTTGHLLRYLTIRGVLQENPESGKLNLTDQGRRLMNDVSLAQLGFYIEAYSPVLAHMTDLMKGTALYDKDVLRNGEALGAHCATLFRVFHTPIILETLRSFGATSILDLGCGGGMLLVDACHHLPELKGYGIDISPGAIDWARRLAVQEGLENRLQFHVGDAFRPDTWPEECLSADVICAVGAVHEHFRNGEQAVIDILNIYADRLQHRGKVFVLGEPELYYDDAENDADLYLVHIFTAQGFPHRRQLWLDLIERSRLKCQRVITRRGIGPRFCFYELTTR